MNDVLDTLLALFQAQFGASFNKYFKGAVGVPAQSNLPMLNVFPVGTSQKHTGTLRDDVSYRIGVEVIVNLKTFFKEGGNTTDELAYQDALIEYVETRDANGNLQNNSIMGVINNNLTISSKVLYTDNMNVDYDKEFAKENFPSARVEVTFDAFTRADR